MTKRVPFSKKSILLLVLLMTILLSCKIATIRSLEEDKEAKAGFNPNQYVESIWDSQLIPTFHEQAIEITDLLGQIDANQNKAIQDHGHRSGTGAYSFMTYGEAKVLAYAVDLRIGTLSLDFAPFDGTTDATMLVGPLIPRRNDAVRDAVGFIKFNDFVNQTEFAEVSNALKNHVLQNVVTVVDPDTITGKTVSFYGAFTLVDRSEIEIVPVTIEIQE
ncbi:MAG: hypothetical protein BroJett018_44270 [Chloroflexota bacterium]|nr:MAG: hypothetical protein BroJett018_44270 [Chloroflexota bacterium]